tara:strand:- start:1788 stop:2777 length:990 start_codon:yes stop_codon:yes gene_type:complete
MIKKPYELKNLYKEYRFYLFYGKNEGAKKEEIKKIISINDNKGIFTHFEKDILQKSESFIEEIFSGSLFEEDKLIIVNQSTDKIIKILETIYSKKPDGITIILNSDVLEKKSKLRSFFEKEKNLICVPFYSDNQETLSKITYSFLKEKNISLSQSNINLIVNRCNGDRGILKNELQKIENYCLNNNNVTSENIIKLTNLIENFSISELIDNCLAKNHKKTLSILNENNFNNEDCILIARILLNKLKRNLKLSIEFQKNKNIEKTISLAKPPIFWKDKEITKQQISKWSPENIKKLITKLGQMELLIKQNVNFSVILMTDFILEQSLVKN